MKSSHSFPLHRSLLAATIVLLTGSIAAFAQSSGSSGSSDSNSNSNSSATNYGSNSASTSRNGSSAMDDNASMSTSDQASSSSSNKLSWSDRRFVTKAADDGQAEVQVAQLAAQKASSPDVRNFAQQLVDQHSQVNSQLMSLAQSKNVKLDKDDGKDRTYRRLSKASGSDFDREFVEHMVDEHEKDIKMFEKAANSAKDPEIRQFASSTLDHLRQHLSEAQQLEQSIVPTGRTDINGGRADTSSSSTSSYDSSATGSTAGGANTSGSSTSGVAAPGNGANANAGSSSSTPSSR